MTFFRKSKTIFRHTIMTFFISEKKGMLLCGLLNRFLRRLGRWFLARMVGWHNRWESCWEVSWNLSGGTWVASRNWSTRMTCLLKKSDKLDIFHYFFLANHFFYKKMIATCSSHHCRPKMTVNLYFLESRKYLFFMSKLTLQFVNMQL